MPAPAGTKRVKSTIMASRVPANKPARIKGVSIYRPFVYGSHATPLPTPAPPGTPPDHTHRWTIYIRPLPSSNTTTNTSTVSSQQNLSHWLRKVQFKLHETYSQSLRTVETPPFEVTETGWGEFEVAIKLFFVPEAGEKPLSVYHQLKLHPYGGTEEEREKIKRDGGDVDSKCYEEVVFNEPVEVFYNVLTSGGDNRGNIGQVNKGKGKAGKAVAKLMGGERTAEIPQEGSPYSLRMEGRELDRLGVAAKTVDAIVVEERKKLAEREKLLAELRKGAAETK